MCRSTATVEDHDVLEACGGELLEEGVGVDGVVAEAALLEAADDVLVVAVVDVQEAVLPDDRPAHHHALARVVRDVVQEVVLELHEDVLAHLEGLHEVVGPAQVQPLAQVHLRDVLRVVEHRVLEPVRRDALLPQDLHVVAPPAPQVGDGPGLLAFVEVDEEGGEFVGEDVFGLVGDGGLLAVFTDLEFISALNVELSEEALVLRAVVVCMGGKLRTASESPDASW